MARLIAFILLSLPFLSVAQEKSSADSLSNDSLHLTEQQLLQQQQQQKVDELIKAGLQKEIEALSHDSKEKQELENRLHTITVRDSIQKLQQQQRIELLRKNAKGFPVLLFQDTIFSIYTRVGSFTTEERAAAISDRLTKLYESDFFNADSLKLLRGDNGYDISYTDGKILMSVSELDGLYHNKTQEQLGNDYLAIIKNAITTRKESDSLFSWAKRIVYVVLVLAGILSIIFLVNRLFKKLSRHLIKKRKNSFNGITIKTYQLFSPVQHLRFILKAVAVLRLAAIVLAFYLSLPILFSIFPQTKTYTYTLLQWIVDPAKTILSGIVSYLPKLFTILVIYFFTRYTIRGIKFLATEVENGKLTIKGFYKDWAQPTYSIIKFLLYAFMLVVAFPYLPGSGSPVFQGVSVFLGILFSLGSSSAISNIVAGLVITYMRPFKIGDRVKIGEITGDVLEKTLLVTRIRTIKNEEITVPNATVLSSHTTNYSKGAEENGIIIHTTVTLGYDLPWKKVHETLIKAALKTELVSKEPLPFVLQTGLEDFYVSYQLNAYTKSPDKQATIYSDLHQHIQDCCNEAGIEILSPHYRAVRDGNMTTIPEDYLTNDYKAPAFRFQQEEKH